MTTPVRTAEIEYVGDGPMSEECFEEIAAVFERHGFAVESAADYPTEVDE